MSDSYFFVYLMLACNVVLLAISAVAVIRFERRWQRLEGFWDSPTGAALNDAGEDDIRRQLQATRRLEQRLGELQRTVTRLDTKPPGEPPTAGRLLPIENAVRMAKLGASEEDLTRNCGLNVGEARLMRRLHGRHAAAATGN